MSYIIGNNFQKNEVPEVSATHYSSLAKGIHEAPEAQVGSNRTNLSKYSVDVIQLKADLLFKEAKESKGNSAEFKPHDYSNEQLLEMISGKFSQTENTKAKSANGPKRVSAKEQEKRDEQFFQERCERGGMDSLYARVFLRTKYSYAQIRQAIEALDSDNSAVIQVAEPEATELMIENSSSMNVYSPEGNGEFSKPNSVLINGGSKGFDHPNQSINLGSLGSSYQERTILSSPSSVLILEEPNLNQVHEDVLNANMPGVNSSIENKILSYSVLPPEIEDDEHEHQNNEIKEIPVQPARVVSEQFQPFIPPQVDKENDMLLELQQPEISLSETETSELTTPNHATAKKVAIAVFIVLVLAGLVFAGVHTGAFAHAGNWMANTMIPGTHMPVSIGVAIATPILAGVIYVTVLCLKYRNKDSNDNF